MGFRHAPSWVPLVSYAMLARSDCTSRIAPTARLRSVPPSLGGAPRERDAAVGRARVAVVTVGQGPRHAAAGGRIAGLGPVARVAVVAGHDDAAADPVEADVTQRAGAAVVAPRAVDLRRIR